MAKLRQRLVALHQQFNAVSAQSRALPFRSNDPLVRTVEDRVVVDAVASGDANVLKTELEALGMQQAVAFGRVVRASCQSQRSPLRQDWRASDLRSPPRR